MPSTLQVNVMSTSKRIGCTSLANIQNQSTASFQSASDIKGQIPRRYSDAVLASLSTRSRQETNCRSLRRSISFKSAGKQRSESGQTLGRKWLHKTFTKWIKKESVAAVFMSKSLSYSSPLLARQQSTCSLKVSHISVYSVSHTAPVLRSNFRQLSISSMWYFVEPLSCIAQTRPCNIQQCFTAVKMLIFR